MVNPINDFPVDPLPFIQDDEDMQELLKYGTAATVYVALRYSGTAQLINAATFGAGDVQISKDGGAFTNLATLPTVVPTSGYGVKVQLSAAELTCKTALLVFHSATSAWNDAVVEVKTFGHSNAFYGFDFSTDTWTASQRTLTSGAAPITIVEPETIGGELITLIQKSARTVEVEVGAVPAGRSAVKAYWTIKNADTDADGSALLMKTVTTVATSSGRIANDGSNGQNIILEFEVSASDLDSFTLDQFYRSSAKLILDNGVPYAPPESFCPVVVRAPGVQATS